MFEDEPELLSMSKTAATLGVSERTIWRWVHLDILHAVRLGGRTFVSCDEVRRVACVGGES
jgi:hypothetical protein